LLEVEPITVARLVDRLEARGVVERRPDPRDRRIWRLHLLPPAWPMLDEISELRTDLARVLTDGVGSRALHTMTEALLRMKSNLAQEAQAARRAADSVVPSARETV
jgi:MarR family transcriptional regulator, transcriptional regulator for hemolysin